MCGGQGGQEGGYRGTERVSKDLARVSSFGLGWNGSLRGLIRGDVRFLVEDSIGYMRIATSVSASRRVA